MDKKSVGTVLANMAALSGAMRPLIASAPKEKKGSTCDPDKKKKRRVQRESRRRNRR